MYALLLAAGRGVNAKIIHIRCICKICILLNIFIICFIK